MRRLALALTLFALGGCYRTRYVDLGPPELLAPGVPREHVNRWQHFFLAGLAPGERVVSVPAVCGDAGAAELETEQTLPQAIVGGLTRVIYTPYTARVVCAGGQRPR